MTEEQDEANRLEILRAWEEVRHVEWPSTVTEILIHPGMPDPMDPDCPRDEAGYTMCAEVSSVRIRRKRQNHDSGPEELFFGYLDETVVQLEHRRFDGERMIEEE